VVRIGRRRAWRIAGWAGCLGVLGFVVLNIAAYRHAHAMLHYSAGGSRTPPPERLAGLRKLRVLIAGVNVPRPHNGRTPADMGLPYTTHRFGGGEGPELEAWLIPREGAAGTVLLFHGYSASKDSLLPEAAAFHQLGYRAMLVDLRGSGGSEGAGTSLGYVESRDVALACAYCREHVSDGALILYGFSMGGAAALKAVADGDARPDATIVEAVFDRMLSAIRNRFRAMRVPAFPSAELLTFWGGVQMGFCGFRHNPAAYAREVRCPVLMLHGRDDPRATPAQAAAVFDSLAGPKRFVPFEGTGHASCLAGNPARWRQAVAAFLAEATAARPPERSGGPRRGPD
jgi:alpha-beta hydrolase superfamily lysophospholipase